LNYGKVIFSLLSNSTDVTGIVGQNIYPVRSANQTPFPYVVYTQVANEPQNVKEKQTPVDIASFQLDCYARNHNTAADLSEKVRAALDKQSGKIAGLEVAGISFQSSDFAFDEDQDVQRVIVEVDLFIQRN